MQTEIKWEKIRLLPINPRFTTVTNIDLKNLFFADYTELACAKELMKYEGDLKDLLELINQIDKNGFMYINDQLLIHLDNKKQYFYVIEGNRRMLAIKLINKEIEFKDISGEKPFFDNVSNDEWNKNKNKILKKLGEMQAKSFKREWVKDISNETAQLIWQTVYSKHVGEQVGKRDWSRAKYFDDLLKQYKLLLRNFKKNQEEIYENLSKMFGKKIDIVKRDLRSAIWIVNSIEMYNQVNNENKIDLRSMEISGFELVLNQKLIINGREKSLKEVLGISINVENLEIEHNKISKKQMTKIIEFLVKNSLNKNITTREIKEDVYDELGDIVGYQLNNRKSLNFVYKELLKKQKEKKLDKLETAKLLSLKNLKSDDIDPKEFLDAEYDSIFIKSIKYTIRNDLKTLTNLKAFDEDEYPFTNVALTIRNIVDLLILETIHRLMDIEEWKTQFELSDDEIEKIERFSNNISDHENHNVNELTGIIYALTTKHGITKSSEFIMKKISHKFKKRLAVLGIDISDEETWEGAILRVLNIKTKFKILHNLVHKPYYGFRNKDNLEMIDKINIMFSEVKSFIKMTGIWKKQH